MVGTATTTEIGLEWMLLNKEERGFKEKAEHYRARISPRKDYIFAWIAIH